MQGRPFGGKNFFSKKKSRSAEKNERGESLVSHGMVCYAEKQEKLFWFSSLDQIVHFDAIIFFRTFVELFWSVRVDRKKRVTIIVAFHFMKRRLKKSHYNSRVSLHEAPTKNQVSKRCKSHYFQHFIKFSVLKKTIRDTVPQIFSKDTEGKLI